MKPSVYAESYTDILVSVIDGPKTVKALQEMTGMHEQTVSRLLHALRSRGLVESRNGTRLAGQDGAVAFEWLWVKK